MESEILKWTGTLFLGISALLVSFNMKWAEQWWAFVGFLIGHIIWTYSAIQMQDMPLIALNVGFMLVDLYAIYLRTPYAKLKTKHT